MAENTTPPSLPNIDSVNNEFADDEPPLPQYYRDEEEDARHHAHAHSYPASIGTSAFTDDDPWPWVRNGYPIDPAHEPLLRRYLRNLSRRILHPWRAPPESDAPVWFHGLDAALPEYQALEGQQPTQMAVIADVFVETLCCSWLNVLLVFVPIGYVAYLRNADPTLVFLFNSLAIVPLSTLLTEATERIASEAGETISAILNISLGNLVELILFVALRNNQLRVVQASILGSILVNLLLILGSALLACGLPDQDFGHYAAGTQLLSSLLFVSVFAFMMPVAFEYTFKNADGAQTATLHMTRASAVMILFIYVVYFIHEIKQHSRKHDETTSNSDDEESHIAVSSLPPSQNQNLPPRTIRFADETASREDSAVKPDENTEMDDLSVSGAPEEEEDDIFGTPGRKGTSIARINSAYSHASRGRRRSQSLTSSRSRLSLDSGVSGERSELMRPYLTTRNILRDSRLSLDRMSVELRCIPYGPKANRIVSLSMLVLTSVLMSGSAEFLASAIDEVTHKGQLSESLIGLIIIPIVGNVSEYATVVTVAARDKMGLALAVSVGSAIQIALCVTPLTIIAAWIMNRPLVLSFNFFETAALIGSVLLVNFLILGEGISGPLRSATLKGGLVCACYVIIGLGAYWYP